MCNFFKKLFWFTDFIFFVALSVVIVLSRETLGLMEIIGLALLIPSLILWLVSRVTLGTSFSIFPKTRELKTDGLYKFFRHPVYVFSLLSWLGLFTYSRNYIILLCLILLFIIQIVRIRKEEQVLIERFGQEYIDYKKKTLF